MLAGLDDTSVVCMVHSGADVFLLVCEVINFFHITAPLRHGVSRWQSIDSTASTQPVDKDENVRLEEDDDSGRPCHPSATSVAQDVEFHRTSTCASNRRRVAPA